MKKGLQNSHWTNDIKLENGKGKVCIQIKTHHGNDNRSITLQETCAINKALKLKKIYIWQTCEGEIYNIITKELYNSLIFPHFLLAATRFGLVVKRMMSGDGFLACSSPCRPVVFDVQADNPAMTENACICQACHTRARRRPAPLERKPNVTQPAKEKTASCGIEYCVEPLVRGTNMKSILNITTGSPSSIMVILAICSLGTAPRLHVCDAMRITTTMWICAKGTITSPVLTRNPCKNPNEHKWT